MLFAGTDTEGVAGGRITAAYRRWAEPRVIEGRVYRTNAGRIEIDSIKRVNPDLISDYDEMLHLAGRLNARDARRRLRGDESLPTWLIRFHLVEGPDPREELAASADLTLADVEELTSKLNSLDSIKQTPWTLATLRLIQSNPSTRAADLAAQVDRDTAGFKIDVRKLKNLGLTHSLEVGYELSPRGTAYLTALD